MTAAALPDPLVPAEVERHACPGRFFASSGRVLGLCIVCARYGNASSTEGLGHESLAPDAQQDERGTWWCLNVLPPLNAPPLAPDRSPPGPNRQWSPHAA